MAIIKARIMQITMSEAEWVLANPVLLDGEWGITRKVDGAIVTYEVRIGDGIRTYMQLQPFLTGDTNNRNIDLLLSTYNITASLPLIAGYYDIESAIMNVPAPFRKPGLKVTFLTDSNIWETYQYQPAEYVYENWINVDNWVKNGKSIFTTDLHSTVGLVKTYRILYTDLSEFFFKVKDGAMAYQVSSTDSSTDGVYSLVSGLIEGKKDFLIPADMDLTHDYTIFDGGIMVKPTINPVTRIATFASVPLDESEITYKYYPIII